MSAPAATAPLQRLPGRDLYALVFGLFLGLAIVKFGNPIILDHQIVPPTSLSEVWTDPWPTYWGNWVLVLLVVAGAGLAVTLKLCWPEKRHLWVLPVIWLGWQFISATQTVDRTLTAATLRHFAGCVACYFVGTTVLGDKRALRWLLVGVLAAFTFCLVRAANQRLVEFPRDRLLLLEGERVGWTNFPAETFQQMKRDRLVISTNGVDVANPTIIAKLTKRRVHGTLVYPNALAGMVLLLWPLVLMLALHSTVRFRSLTRIVVIALAVLLGGAGLYWTGSKSGWLIALAMGGVGLFWSNLAVRWKWTALTTMLVIGLAVFAFRFQSYFAGGATSVGARVDYWRAAARITAERPLLGSGPGTFQRPYARLKSPQAEMARLTHNDYLEQFCDSGIMGGISYTAWIGLLLLMLGRSVWRFKDPLQFAAFLGLLGWFAQELGEFGLYVPALAWTAFTLAGWLVGTTPNRIDKSQAGR